MFRTMAESRRNRADYKPFALFLSGSRNICADGGWIKFHDGKWFSRYCENIHSRLEFFPWLKRNQFARWIFFAFDLPLVATGSVCQLRFWFCKPEKKKKWTDLLLSLNSYCFRANSFSQIHNRRDIRSFGSVIIILCFHITASVFLYHSCLLVSNNYYNWYILRKRERERGKKRRWN